MTAPVGEDFAGRPSGSPIIDCHVHLNNYHEQTSISLEQGLDKLQAAMQESGVGYSLVLTSYIVSEHRPSTAQVVKAVEKTDTLGVVAGISYKNFRQRDLRDLAHFLGAGLVKGLKLYPGYEPFCCARSRADAASASSTSTLRGVP